MSFDLNYLFDPEYSGIDIIAALDGNKDGVIEIYPGDPDGNHNLAKLIVKRIKDIVEAFEDSYDD